MILPGPIHNDQELECELRRSGYMKAFESYEEEEDMNIRNERIFSGKNEHSKPGVNIYKKILSPNVEINAEFVENKNKKNKMSSQIKTLYKKKKKKKKDIRDPLNLKPSEIKAMKGLKEKTKEGSIVISQTDKSSRFAVLSKKAISQIRKGTYYKR